MQVYPVRAGKTNPHRRASPSIAISVADGLGGVRSKVLPIIFRIGRIAAKKLDCELLTRSSCISCLAAVGERQSYACDIDTLAVDCQRIAVSNYLREYN